MADKMNILEELISEGKATIIADKILNVLEKDPDEAGFYIIMTAMENVLVEMMLGVDEAERFPILSSLLHNTAIKLYEAEEEKNNG